MLKHLLLILLILHICNGWFFKYFRRRRVNGGWSGWSTISSGCKCDHSIGRGYILQIRHCDNPRPSSGGRSCYGASTEDIRCTCCRTINGGWTPWAAWSRCRCDSRTGTGIRWTSRSCTSPRPYCFGLGCTGGATKTERCDDECCKRTDGGWSDWRYSGKCSCDFDTGEGIEEGTRVCNSPAPCEGKGCVGDAKKTEKCDDQCCKKTHGGWTDWAAWSRCSCNFNTGWTGTRSTARSCTSPKPSCGGSFCTGDATKTERCVRTDGGWTDWDAWGKCCCDFNTGAGTKDASRTCTSPAPSCGGKYCAGEASITDKCDEECCKKTDGGWTDWTAWSDCYCLSQSGTGMKLSSRACTNPAPSCGGAQCVGDKSRKSECNDDCCTRTEGGWSPYGPFTKCTCDPATGAGTKTAVKTCTNPLPACGGGMCEGSAIKTEWCNTECCVKVNGEWSGWTAWINGCDTKCGPGVQKRDRRCAEPAPSCNGKECMGVDKETVGCSNTCGVMTGYEAFMTTGDPVKLKCTLYGNTRKFLAVQWKTKGGTPILNGGSYQFLPVVVTPFYSTMTMVVSNLKADAEYVCSFVFGQDQVVESKVRVEFKMNLNYNELE